MDTNRAFIPIVKETSAEGELKEYYNKVQNSDGIVDNVMAVHSLNPATGHAHNALYSQAMQGPSSLSVAEREAVGLTVSYINSCRYESVLSQIRRSKNVNSLQTCTLKDSFSSSY